MEKKPRKRRNVQNGKMTDLNGEDFSAIQKQAMGSGRQEPAVPPEVRTRSRRNRGKYQPYRTAIHHAQVPLLNMSMKQHRNEIYLSPEVPFNPGLSP